MKRKIGFLTFAIHNWNLTSYKTIKLLVETNSNAIELGFESPKEFFI